MIIRPLIMDSRGSSAAEFALVLPLLILFLFGIIDGGRWLWAFNQAEKATQIGARVAVVTTPVAGGLVTADYLGVGGLTQGDIIPRSAFGKVACTSTACCVPAAPCTNPHPAVGTFNSAAFQTILGRMQSIKADIKPANVIVSYEGSGLGFAGDPDPNRMDVSPLVTVKLTGMTFKPIATLLITTLNMPDFRTTLTAEDSAGSQSN